MKWKKMRNLKKWKNNKRRINRKQISKHRKEINWLGVIRGFITPLTSSQPIQFSCRSAFCDWVWCNNYLNHQLKLPQQDFSKLCSQLQTCQGLGANHQKCSSIFAIQVNITGVICRVVTPKDMIRYPSLLTKQWKKCTKTGFTCRVITHEDKERYSSSQ